MARDPNAGFATVAAHASPADPRRPARPAPSARARPAAGRRARHPRARPAGPRAWCSTRSTVSSSATGCRAARTRCTCSAPRSARGAWPRPAWTTRRRPSRRWPHDYIHQHYEHAPGQGADGRARQRGVRRQAARALRRPRGARCWRIRATGCTCSPAAAATCSGARAGCARRWATSARSPPMRVQPQGDGRLAGARDLLRRRASRCRCTCTTSAPHVVPLTRRQPAAEPAGQLLDPVLAAGRARHPRRARAAPTGTAASPTTTCT